MSDPVIITTAITGSQPRKKNNPAVPVEPNEQIESTHEAFEAGSSLVHIHVRDENEDPSSDPELFARVQEGVKKHCPGMIIQFSTGGRGRNQDERGSMLHLKPDMASLSTGSVNFKTMIYENTPDLVVGLAKAMKKYGVKPEIEVFDAAMLYNAVNMAEEGLIEGPLHVQFVTGIPNAMPSHRPLLEFLVAELKRMMPEATWSAMGVARTQLIVNEWCIEMDGHIRTGLEDNVRYDKDRLAKSNAELVERVARMVEDAGKKVATPAEARTLLKLAA